MSEATATTAASVAPATTAAPAAPAAPAQAPAAAQATTPTPTPAGTEEGGVEVVQYQPTDDPRLDSVLEFVGKQGIGPDDPALTAALQNGDFTLIKAKLAQLGVPGSAEMVAIGESLYKEHMAKTEASEKAVADAVFAAIGGEENWKAIHDHVAANATPEEKAAINDVLSGGDPIKARIMAMGLQSMLMSNGEYKPSANVQQPGSNGNAARPGMLTKSEYTQEVARLQREGGATPQALQALAARVMR